MVIEEEATEPSSDADDLSDRPTRSLGSVFLIGGLVLAVVSSVVLGVLLVQSLGTSSEDVGDYLDAERPEAEAVALEVLDGLLNYDSTNIEDVADRMLDVATGNFKEQYEDLVLEGGLADALTNATASSRGEILDGPDIFFSTPTEAIAIARVSQITQSSENPTGRTFEYILQLTLIDTADAGWKADRVDLLSEGES